MRSQLKFQATVVSADAPDPSGNMDKVALFNADGSPFTGGRAELPVKRYVQGVDAGFGYGPGWEAFDYSHPTEHPAVTIPPKTRFQIQGSKIWILREPDAYQTAPMNTVSAVGNTAMLTIPEAEIPEGSQEYFSANVRASANLYDSAYNPRNASAVIDLYFYLGGSDTGIWFSEWGGPFVGSGYSIVTPNAGDRVAISFFGGLLFDNTYPDPTE